MFNIDVYDNYTVCGYSEKPYRMYTFQVENKDQANKIVELLNNTFGNELVGDPTLEQVCPLHYSYRTFSWKKTPSCKKRNKIDDIDEIMRKFWSKPLIVRVTFLFDDVAEYDKIIVRLSHDYFRQWTVCSPPPKTGRLFTTRYKCGHDPKNEDKIVDAKYTVVEFSIDSYKRLYYSLIPESQHIDYAKHIFKKFEPDLYKEWEKTISNTKAE